MALVHYTRKRRMGEKNQTWKQESWHTDRATFKIEKRKKNMHAQRWSFNIMSGWERSEKNVPVQHVTNRIHRVHSGTSASCAIESSEATQPLQNILCSLHQYRNRSSITCKLRLHVPPLFCRVHRSYQVVPAAFIWNLVSNLTGGGGVLSVVHHSSCYPH